ncbi:MAG: hypothetical protein HY548_06280, partial [Elusimicrobia bacterium]|nr:hypothetical protein [Elusimicrobiota bacterium]
VIAGQAKLKETVTRSTTNSIDGSTTHTFPYKTIYTYKGEELFENGRGPGNWNDAEKEEYAALVRDGTVGQLIGARLERMVSPVPSVRMTDTDATVTLQDGEKVIFNGNYPIVSVTTDAFGNKSYTFSSQEFKVLFGQAKLKETTSASVSDGIDGTYSKTEPYATQYSYWGEEGTAYANFVPSRQEGRLAGLLAKSEIKQEGMPAYSPTNPINAGTLGTYRIKTTTVDAFDNKTESFSNQTYKVLFGTAKLKEAESTSISTSVDGSTSVTEPYTTTYWYYGETLSEEERWNMAALGIQEPPLIAGVGEKSKGLLAHAAITSTRHGVADPFALVPAGEQPRTFYFDIKTVTQDAIDNVTTSYSNQTFKVIFGQAKLKTVRNASITESVDGSTSVTYAYTTTYSYYGEADEHGEMTFPDNPSTKTYRGLLAKAEITSGKNWVEAPFNPGAWYSFDMRTVTKDAFDNVTTSYSNQTFKVIFGQAKLKTSQTGSITKSSDGSTSVTHAYTTTYSYYGERDDQGWEMTFADNPSTQTYSGLLAKAEITSDKNQVEDPFKPGELHSFDMKTVTKDLFDNVTTSYSNQTFKVIFGQAKLKTSQTGSITASVDGSTSVTYAYTTVYWYFGEVLSDEERWNLAALGIPERPFIAGVGERSKGLLAHAEISSRVTLDYSKVLPQGLRPTDSGEFMMMSVNVDLFGNKTTTYTSQTFKVIAGQAKLKTSTTASLTETVEGINTFTYAYTTTYWYYGETFPPNVRPYVPAGVDLLAGSGKTSRGLLAHAEITSRSYTLREGAMSQQDDLLGKCTGNCSDFTRSDAFKIKSVTWDALLGEFGGSFGTGFGNMTVSYSNQTFGVSDKNGTAKLKRVDSFAVTFSGYDDLQITVDEKGGEVLLTDAADITITMSWTEYGVDGEGKETATGRSLTKSINKGFEAQKPEENKTDDVTLVDTEYTIPTETTTYTHSINTYENIKGKWVVTRVESVSDSTTVRTTDNKVTGESHTTSWNEYYYDKNTGNRTTVIDESGRRITGKGESVTTSWGISVNEKDKEERTDSTTTTTSYFVLINGDAKLAETFSRTITTTKTTGADAAPPKTTYTDVTTSYFYDNVGAYDHAVTGSRGRLSMAIGEGTIRTQDEEGNWMNGEIKQTYEVVWGAAKLS